ncbi:DoxX family protein [Brevundimonas sp.]|uniref:DoxX family protein n=1 Tax=Brevundimonas sp. TaxID=1871086 RepID=UPI0025E2EEC9|nr:DoxX family protein [Brevundimonas sp.]
MNLYDRICITVTQALPEAAHGLLLRTAVAVPFFLSGRTKVDGLITVTPTTHYLFAEEYRVPLLPADLAAYMATYAEHILPALLVFGLLTRPAALGLIAMTLVIQLFVIPTGWPTHLLWLAPLVYVLARGPGDWSLDRLLGLERRGSPGISGLSSLNPHPSSARR